MLSSKCKFLVDALGDRIDCGCRPAYVVRRFSRMKEDDHWKHEVERSIYSKETGRIVTYEISIAPLDAEIWCDSSGDGPRANV